MAIFWLITITVALAVWWVERECSIEATQAIVKSVFLSLRLAFEAVVVVVLLNTTFLLIGFMQTGTKAKLQQVMMTVAQKAPFELVALDGPASGFTDSFETAAALAAAIAGIAGLDRSRLLLFGGWESASRGAGTTMQMVAERLGIAEQFLGVDQIVVSSDGSFEVLERVEGGRHQVSVCTAPR